MHSSIPSWLPGNLYPSFCERNITPSPSAQKTSFVIDRFPEAIRSCIRSLGFIIESGQQVNCPPRDSRACPPLAPSSCTLCLHAHCWVIPVLWKIPFYMLYFVLPSLFTARDGHHWFIFFANHRRNAQADAVGEGLPVSKTEGNADGARVCVSRIIC